MLGRREPEIYGTTTLQQVQQSCEQLANELDLVCEFRQTNSEAVMVDWIQEAFDKNAAVIINPAGLSFNSIPVLDALKLIKAPLVEVHISNIHARDELHRNSIMSTVANGVIAGGWRDICWRLEQCVHGYPNDGQQALLLRPRAEIKRVTEAQDIHRSS
ncbi:type II 3-dehydroquinate dehydratase [Pseudomonas sp. BP01]|uniref:type II 3-dehydroquinate dehydratase n=1 Tax=Pseudomonas sp. BP01 TaxID=2976152 RepID=UPI001FAAF957|nr:type II 3-dehydroquinate dehydratase [Pseudomonas sp. BP01]